MNISSPNSLQWSAQLEVIPAALTSRLQGDKIVLPQSALEQLLSAATVTVASDEPLQGLASTWDPFNPYSYAVDRQARQQVYERNQQLPQPLTFRIVNPANGNVVYAGIREFSAAEGQIGLSLLLRQALGLDMQQDTIETDGSSTGKTGTVLTIHAHQLPKGTFVRFRPLEAGYEVEDWKPLLERHMRDMFTTLTSGEVLSIPNGKVEYKFLIDKLAPEGDGICIVDTDLEVDIEALSEEQARESLKRRLEKSQRVPESTSGSSLGGDLSTGNDIMGKVLPGEYVDYTLKTWDRSLGLDVKLHCDDAEGMVDLLVSPFSARQQTRPRMDDHLFGDLTERAAKRVRIQHSNTELEGSDTIWISVHGYSLATNNGYIDQPGELVPLQYSLKVSQSTSPTSQSNASAKGQSPDPDDTQCKNCQQWVPRASVFLHENFCFRNNVRCPRCYDVFKKSSVEWQNHWHCEHDDAHGNSIMSFSKHKDIFHTRRTCLSCSFEASNVPDLAGHRTSLCPGKMILCQFCHLVVPQQGPDDLSPSDPEVIFSGLTPHELADGARTTECHLCGKIVRLRDMATHLKHHNLERLSRITPRTCRNANCGKTLDGVGLHGEIRRPRPNTNDIGLCETCYGPLYNSAFDPENRALKRRVERRYLTQLLTGCGKDWCRNEYCKTGRRYLGLEKPERALTSKDATALTKPILEQLIGGRSLLHFCTDEVSQKRRVLADLMAAENSEDGVPNGYELAWCIAGLEAESGDLDKARIWLENWAPTRAETSQ